MISRYTITKEHLHISPSSSPHITCAVFNENPEALTPNIVHHFIVGQDEAPTPFSPADARARAIVLGELFSPVRSAQRVAFQSGVLIAARPGPVAASAYTRSRARLTHCMMWNGS